MSFKGYELETKYCWVDHTPVKMYFIAGMPFTFDSLEKDEKENQWVLAECALNPEFTLDYIYSASDYLIMEEAHPLLFDVPVLNPELLPDESV